MSHYKDVRRLLRLLNLVIDLLVKNDYCSATDADTVDADTVDATVSHAATDQTQEDLVAALMKIATKIESLLAEGKTPPSISCQLKKVVKFILDHSTTGVAIYEERLNKQQELESTDFKVGVFRVNTLLEVILLLLNWESE